MDRQSPERNATAPTCLQCAAFSCCIAQSRTQVGHASKSRPTRLKAPNEKIKHCGPVPSCYRLQPSESSAGAQNKQDKWQCDRTASLLTNVPAALHRQSHRRQKPLTGQPRSCCNTHKAAAELRSIGFHVIAPLPRPHTSWQKNIVLSG